MFLQFEKFLRWFTSLNDELGRLSSNMLSYRSSALDTLNHLVFPNSPRAVMWEIIPVKVVSWHCTIRNVVFPPLIRHWANPNSLLITWLDVHYFISLIQISIRQMMYWCDHKFEILSAMVDIWWYLFWCTDVSRSFQVNKQSNY